MIQHNVSLLPFNTLAVDVTAASFVEVTTETALKECLRVNDSPLLILGGGSNLVLTADFSGLVILNRIAGIEMLAESQTDVLIRVGGGEVWDELVRYTIEHQWFGLENLSWIPGTVGAAPIQNIGAYGVELKDCLESVETIGTKDRQRHQFSREECRFGYRESIFKQAEKGRHVIVAVVLRLSKIPAVTVDYGDIQSCASAWGYDLASLTPAQVREIIIRIRSEKLPDPAVTPNVGSFFKNPVVSESQYAQLLVKAPGMVAYPQGDGCVKLAAGWLIDHLGWKGRHVGLARVHDRQALVLVNEGVGSADVLTLANRIQSEVEDFFGVVLEIEPNIV